MSSSAFELPPPETTETLSPSILDVAAIIDPDTGNEKPVLGIRPLLKDIPVVEVETPTEESSGDIAGRGTNERHTVYVNHVEAVLHDGTRARMFPGNNVVYIVPVPVPPETA